MRTQGQPHSQYVGNLTQNIIQPQLLNLDTKEDIQEGFQNGVDAVDSAIDDVVDKLPDAGKWLPKKMQDSPKTFWIWIAATAAVFLLTCLCGACSKGKFCLFATLAVIELAFVAFYLYVIQN